MRIIKDLLILISFFCLSAGVFYGGAKFHVPWYGANDFDAYYKMTAEPFNNSATAPFAYRVLTPTIAHFVEKSEIFYDSKITPYKNHYLFHDGQTYRPSTLSALIFSNYIFFALAAFFLYKTFSALLGSENIRDRMIALGSPSLLFLSLSTVVHGYAGLTEGGSIFFVSILCYFMVKNRLFLFFVFSVLSVLQRELIPLVLLMYTLFSSQFPNRLNFAIVSLGAFLLYFAVKAYFQIPGNEHQTQAVSLLSNILSFSINKEFFLQAVLANNIPIFLALAAIAVGHRNLKPFIPFVLTFIMLATLGIATGIGNNVGRILNLTTPLLLIGVALAIPQKQTEDMVKASSV